MRRRKIAKQSGTKIDVSRLKTVCYLSGENDKIRNTLRAFVIKMFLRLYCGWS